MSKVVVWADPEDSVETTLASMDRCRTNYVLLGQANRLDGIVSRSDLQAALSPYLRPQFYQYRRISDDASLQIKIKWLASRTVNTTVPDATLVAAMDKMCRFGGKCLPVVDERHGVQGLLQIPEILSALIPAGSLSGIHDDVRQSEETSPAPLEQPDDAQHEQSGPGADEHEDEVPKESPMELDAMTEQTQQPADSEQAALEQNEPVVAVPEESPMELDTVTEQTEARAESEPAELEQDASEEAVSEESPVKRTP